MLFSEDLLKVQISLLYSLPKYLKTVFNFVRKIVNSLQKFFIRSNLAAGVEPRLFIARNIKFGEDFFY